MTPTTLNLAKYEQAILYFLSHCNTPHLGKTKLMKLLYYLDFDHFEQHDAPVTGDRYIRKPYGPVPEAAERVLAAMEADGRITHETSHVYQYTQDRYYPRVSGDTSVFTLAELNTLAAVCARWGSATRHEIVEATHQEAPWMAVKDYDEIPYQYAYYRNHYDELDVSDEEGGYLTPDAIVAQAE